MPCPRDRTRSRAQKDKNQTARQCCAQRKNSTSLKETKIQKTVGDGATQQQASPRRSLACCHESITSAGCAKMLSDMRRKRKTQSGTRMAPADPRRLRLAMRPAPLAKSRCSCQGAAAAKQKATRENAKLREMWPQKFQKQKREL